MSRTGMITAKMLLLFVALAYLALLLMLREQPRDDRLIFSSWGTVEETQNLERLVELYNASHPAQPVTFNHVDMREYDRKILIQTAAGNPPDVFLLSATDIGTMAFRGVLEELTAWISNDPRFQTGDFFPALWETATIRSRVYGIPLGYTPMVIYYNRRLLRAAGVPDPDSSWTWEDFLRIAIRLTQRDEQGRVKQVGCMISMAGYSHVYSFGGDFYDDGTQCFRLDHPKTIAALEFYGDLAMKHRVTTSPTEKLFTSDQGFRQEAVAMIAAGRWQVPNFAATNLDWGVAPMPQGESPATGVIAYNVVMSKFCQQKPQAWAFMKFLADSLAQSHSAKSGNLVPARRAVAYSSAFLDDTTFHVNNRIFLHGIAHGRPWPMEIAPETSFMNHWLILNEEMEKAMLGHQTYAEAAMQAETRLNDILRFERAQTQGKRFWGSRTSYLLGGVIFIGAAALILRKALRR